MNFSSWFKKKEEKQKLVCKCAFEWVIGDFQVVSLSLSLALSNLNTCPKTTKRNENREMTTAFLSFCFLRRFANLFAVCYFLWFVCLLFVLLPVFFLFKREAKKRFRCRNKWKKKWAHTQISIETRITWCCVIMWFIESTHSSHRRPIRFGCNFIWGRIETYSMPFLHLIYI